MSYLIHTDFLADAVSRPNADADAILALCRRKRVKGWVLAESLGAVASAARQNGSEAVARLDGWLSALSILPLTGKEVRAAVNKPGFGEALAAHGVKAFRLTGVITLHPETFTGENVRALQPREVAQQSGEEKPVAGPVPLLDLRASYHDVWEDVEQEMADVARSGQFILGSKVSGLEEKIAAYCQCKYAVGMSSGTDALLAALMAAGIGQGDEVITTPYTFFATMGSIARAGARPMLVDIDPLTYNIDPDRIADKITSKTKAIMPVHLYGQCADMDPILEIAQKHSLVVIEDAAQAIGSEYKFRRAGSMGDYGCFSFFPTKNLGGFGDGGIITTNSKENHERLLLLRVHGSRQKYYHKLVGGNFRLDALQAAVVGARLKYLEGWTEKRRQNAATYGRLFKDRGLADKIGVPKEIFPRHVYNQYVIRAPGRRNDLQGVLKGQGISTEIYYPVPLHLQECFAALEYRKGAFPESEKAADETLALPISQEVTPAQQEYVVDTLRDFFA